MRIGVSIAVVLLLFSCGSNTNPDEQTGEEISKERIIPEGASAFGTQLFYWIYEDDFTEDEQLKLEQWIVEIGEATIETLGQYPFDVEVTFHRSEGDRPVSFGHTDRGMPEGVHFYVDPTFSLEELLADWTAPHEIAHLALPFSGPRVRWFSEGFATYLSRRIMMNMGYYTDQEFDSLYRSKIASVMDYYGSCTKSHIEVADSLVDHSNYGSMYWGSSSFFLIADSLLQDNHNMRFEDVVVEYQTQGRMEDKVLQEVMNSYDAIIDDTLFNSLMYCYRNIPCCELMQPFAKE